MEGNADAPERPIRHSESLCAGEQDYVNKRKEKVLESLSSLGIDCTADDVPHIALLASGGGERAAMGSLGSLHQMEKEGFLDTFLYIGGISGSTWTMSFLYSDPHWSTDMDKAITRLSESKVEPEEAVAWLEEKVEDEDFSLSHVWGALTSAVIMKQLDMRHLSDEADRNATNPYPIYCAIERESFDKEIFEGFYIYMHMSHECERVSRYCIKCNKIICLSGQWFEVSPHEAGFTEMGVFVETSLLGSKFNGGGLLERPDEMDMVKLQGITGSAMGDLETTKKTIKETILSWHRDKEVKSNESAPREPGSLEERQNLTAAEDWSQYLENGTHALGLISKVFSLMTSWEWGTTANFLYKYQASCIPPCLHSKETLNLIDAGLLMNVPYPSFLGDKREIDLIIAPEYSAGEMFETLTKARVYAQKSKRPFPEIDEKILEEDKEWPQGCYVFEGKEKAPTIVYMPLFNRQNCKDAEEFKERMEEFRTLQFAYSQEKIDVLLKTARANVVNNKETLLQEIKKAALRKQSRKGPGNIFDFLWNKCILF